MRVKQEATAGDRSPKTIEATAGRTAEHVEAGKAGFVVGSLENCDVGDRRFDRIFAVRVGLFHRHAERAHRLVGPWLAPAGRGRPFFHPLSVGKGPR